MATAADIMTRDVVTVTPETPVGDVAELLASKRFGSVPVIDANGVVLGLVAEEDLVQRSARLRLPHHLTFLGSVIYLENPQHFKEDADKILALTAGEIMEEHFFSTRPDTPVEEVASRLLNEDIRRLLVLDENRRLLGLITRADIVRMLVTGDRLPDEPAQ